MLVFFVFYSRPCTLFYGAEEYSVIEHVRETAYTTNNKDEFLFPTATDHPSIFTIFALIAGPTPGSRIYWDPARLSCS